MNTIKIRQIFKAIRTKSLDETDYLIQHGCTVGDFCHWYVVCRLLKLKETEDIHWARRLPTEEPMEAGTEALQVYPEKSDTTLLAGDTEAEKDVSSETIRHGPKDPEHLDGFGSEDGEPDDTI